MLKTAEDIRQLNERITYAGQFVDRLREEVGHVIVGQSHMLDRLLIGLLSNFSMVLAGNPERVIKSYTASGFNPFLEADKMLIGLSKYLMYLVISPEDDFRLRETVLMAVKVETFFHL